MQAVDVIAKKVVRGLLLRGERKESGGWTEVASALQQAVLGIGIPRGERGSDSTLLLARPPAAWSLQIGSRIGQTAPPLAGNSSTISHE